MISNLWLQAKKRVDKAFGFFIENYTMISSIELEVAGCKLIFTVNSLVERVVRGVSIDKWFCCFMVEMESLF